jgi:uncharacterized protein
VQLAWLMVSGMIVCRMRGLSHPRWRPVWVTQALWALPAGLLLNAAVAVAMLRGAATVLEPPSLWSAAHALIGPLLSFGLLAWAAAHRPAALLRLAPAGQRSLSIYLASSLLLALVFGGVGLGLGPRLGSVATAAVASILAIGLVLAALSAQRAGRRGTLERWLSS